MFQPFRKYADFHGRATRAEYWLFTLFLFVINMGLNIVDWAFGTTGASFNELSGLLSSGEIASEPTTTTAQQTLVTTLVNIVAVLFALGTIVPSIAVTVRRLRDAGFAWWWIIVRFAGLLVGGIVIIVGIIVGFTISYSSSSIEAGLMFGVIIALIGILLFLATLIFSFVQDVWPSKREEEVQLDVPTP